MGIACAGRRLWAGSLRWWWSRHGGAGALLFKKAAVSHYPSHFFAIAIEQSQSSSRPDVQGRSSSKQQVRKRVRTNFPASSPARSSRPAPRTPEARSASCMPRRRGMMGRWTAASRQGRICAARGASFGIVIPGSVCSASEELVLGGGTIWYHR